MANAEIKEAVAWYRDINNSLAEGFNGILDTAIDRIARSPEQLPVDVHDLRHVLLDRFPKIIIDRIQETAVQILAVARTKHSPGYWRLRG